MKGVGAETTSEVDAVVAIPSTLFSLPRMTVLDLWGCCYLREC